MFKIKLERAVSKLFFLKIVTNNLVNIFNIFNFSKFQNGQTPLHVAVYFGHVNIVLLLMQNGASLEAKTIVRMKLNCFLYVLFCRNCQSEFNPFYATVLFPYPQKTLENPHQKTLGFLMFSGGIGRNQWVNRSRYSRIGLYEFLSTAKLLL